MATTEYLKFKKLEKGIPIWEFKEPKNLTAHSNEHKKFRESIFEEINKKIGIESLLYYNTESKDSLFAHIIDGPEKQIKRAIKTGHPYSEKLKNEKRKLYGKENFKNIIYFGDYTKENTELRLKHSIYISFLEKGNQAIMGYNSEDVMDEANFVMKWGDSSYIYNLKENAFPKLIIKKAN